MYKKSEPNKGLKKAKGYAYRLLARKARTEYELRKKMDERGFDAPTIEIVLENLKKYNFINDSEYAQKLAGKRLFQNRWGKRKIKQELIQKGIAEEIVEEVINGIEEVEEYRTALFSAQKKLKSLSKKIENCQNMDESKSEDILRKVILHLDRKGFSVEVIKLIYKNFIDKT